MPMMGTTTKGGTTAAAATDKRIIKEQTTADVAERVAIEQEGRSGAGERSGLQTQILFLSMTRNRKQT